VISHATSPPLTETLLKQLKECKVALREKERELGEDHSEILNAMDWLAWTYQELGQFRQAKVLRVAMFEKQKRILGDDHPDTLRTMSTSANPDFCCSKGYPLHSVT
jgi:hypothetical protein